MRIVTYKTMLNEYGHAYLVKEKALNYPEENKLNTAQKIVNLMNAVFKMSHLDTEYIYMISMNTNCRLLGIFEVSHGLVNSSLISPRELIIKAMLTNAVNIIVIHNHPSECCNPSKEDFLITKRLQNAFELVGLNLLDHIIIAGDSFYSFAEKENL